jgi:DNA-binding LacI/PurR family transcriptional regulator
MASKSGPHRRTLAEVAQAAGTSSPIASRILNNDPKLNVGDDLRERVREAAARLSYRPHAAARALRRSSSGALAFLIPTLSNPVFTEMVRGAFARALERDYIVLLMEDSDGQETGRIVSELIAGGRADGLLIASAQGPSWRQLRDDPLLSRTPHVYLNRAVDGSHRNVVLDDDQGIRLAVDHLVALGHTRLAHVDGPLEIDPAARRSQAFRSYTSQLGLPDPRVYSGDFLSPGGASVAEEVFRSNPEVTGIIVSGPSQAAGFLTVASAVGRRVPEDLSIVSYTDAQLARVVSPALTVVHMPLAEMGALGVDQVLRQLDGGSSEDVVVPGEPRLVVRASTGAAPQPAVSGRP